MCSLFKKAQDFFDNVYSHTPPSEQRDIYNEWFLKMVEEYGKGNELNVVLGAFQTCEKYSASKETKPTCTQKAVTLIRALQGKKGATVIALALLALAGDLLSDFRERFLWYLDKWITGDPSSYEHAANTTLDYVLAGVCILASVLIGLYVYRPKTVNG